MQLFRDAVVLWANSDSLDSALAFARDFRACSRTAMLGPNFFVANGPNGVRCFHELGITDVVLDLRLTGNPREVWQCVAAAAQLGVKGITVHPLAGRVNLENAIRAADASRAQTHKVERPKILVSPLPPHIDDAEMIDDMGMRIRRKEHVKHVAEAAAAAGVDGMIVEYEDVSAVRKVSKDLASLVFAQKKPRNYAEIEASTVRNLASITDILQARVAHVIFDSQLVHNTDAEWCADMLLKEVTAGRPKRQVKTNVLQSAN